MKIFTVSFLVIFFCLVSFGRSDTEPPEPPEPEPELEQLTSKEVQVLYAMHENGTEFLFNVYKLYKLYDETMRFIIPNVTAAIAQVLEVDKKLQDKIHDDKVVRNSNARKVTSQSNETFVPAVVTNASSGLDIFGQAMEEIEQYLFALGEDKPKIEFMYLNLEAQSSTVKSEPNRRRVEKLLEDEGKTPSENWVADLYTSKAELTHSIYKSIMEIEEHSVHTFKKLRVLAATYKKFKQFVYYLTSFQPIFVNQSETVDVEWNEYCGYVLKLIDKFNWEKRYRLIEKTIFDLKQVQFFEISTEAYKSDLAMVTTGTSVKSRSTLRRWGKWVLPILDAVIELAKNMLDGLKKKIQQSLEEPPKVSQYNTAWTVEYSIIQAIAIQVMNGKATGMSFKPYFEGENQDFKEGSDERKKMDDKPDPPKKQSCPAKPAPQKPAGK